MKSVEPRVKVGDEELGREGGEESLSVASHVGRDLGALSESNLFEKRDEPESDLELSQTTVVENQADSRASTDPSREERGIACSPVRRAECWLPILQPELRT